MKLAALGVNVSVGGQQVTSIYNGGLASLVTASVHYYNTEEEIELLGRAVGIMSVM